MHPREKTKENLRNKVELRISNVTDGQVLNDDLHLSDITILSRGNNHISPDGRGFRNIPLGSSTTPTHPSLNTESGLKRNNTNRQLPSVENAQDAVGNYNPNILVNHIDSGTVVESSSFNASPTPFGTHGINGNKENIHLWWRQAQSWCTPMNGHFNEDVSSSKFYESSQSSRSMSLNITSGLKRNSEGVIRTPLKPIENIQKMVFLKPGTRIGYHNIMNADAPYRQDARSRRKKIIHERKSPKMGSMAVGSDTPCSVITSHFSPYPGETNTQSVPPTHGQRTMYATSTNKENLELLWKHSQQMQNAVKRISVTSSSNFISMDTPTTPLDNASNIRISTNGIQQCWNGVNPSNKKYINKHVVQTHEVLQSIRNTPILFDTLTDDEEDAPVGEQPGASFYEQNQYLMSPLYDKGENQPCFDIGDPSFYCKHCKARLWSDELFVKVKNTLLAESSICCMKGKIELPLLKEPPTLLLNLLSGEDHRSNHYKENIRAYNSMFAFTSMGGKIENNVNDGGGPPQFIISGQNYHRIGSLTPEQGKKPKFSQLYIYDTANELSNRVGHFGSYNNSSRFDMSLVEDLTKMVDDFNPYAKSYRKVQQIVENNEQRDFCLWLLRKRSKDARMHNTPTSNEVAALIIGDLSSIENGRDVICWKSSGELERVHETQTSFIPLQYPLIFPYGEDGFQEDIKLSESQQYNPERKRLRVSLREFIAFRIQDRCVEFGNIVRSQRLFQQFVVDCYTMLESQRLSFIRANQAKIRCDILNGLQDAVSRGETDPGSAGRRIILPSSFTGGMRYMFNNCQDAMATCKRYGYPDLFITITCNSSWREIHEFLLDMRLKATDHADIVCRVFKIKLDQLMTDLRKGVIFGNIDAVMHTVEFQKRGLPHAHILLWLNEENKIKTGTDINNVITAELPDPTLYPKLAEAVSKYMIHDPCGVANPKSPCMQDRKCSKYYPKQFTATTTIDDDGYPKYRRRDTGISIEKMNTTVDNRSVVPYNPHLLMRYEGHVNVEYCNKSNSIKYLFKYVNKGPDRAYLQISNSDDNSDTDKLVDEIRQYYDCRYVSPCEAVWRTFAFDIHHKWPLVQSLVFHLPNHQTVYFNDNEDIEKVARRGEWFNTMFLAWFEANMKFSEGMDLTYAEFPSRFVYNKEQRSWQLRKKGKSIGRLQYIPPGVGELYYLRILLTIQKGCTSYDSIRTVDGTTYNTFQEACYVLGLLADDKEFIDAIREASQLGSGRQVRRLFVTLLLMHTMTSPDVAWNSTWRLLSDGIVYDRRRQLNIQGLQIQDDDLQNLCLIELENLLRSNGRSIADYPTMPYPNISDIHDFQNKLIVDELDYDREQLARDHKSFMERITPEQKSVYDEIISSVFSDTGGFFFVSGYGGSGKTFLWNGMSAGLRSQGFIVLNVASSGIASLLLPRGKTAHSTFSIPLVINEESTCNINQGSVKAKFLIHTKLIIWDEAPMMNRFCFEAFDRTLRDIMGFQDSANRDKPFGGKTVVLGGDFRQILPVIRRGSRQDIVDSSINSSNLWQYCKVLRLTVNMRLAGNPDRSDMQTVKQFGEWILKIGEGDDNANEMGQSDIEFPHDLLIHNCQEPLQSLVDFAYPEMQKNLNSSNYFDERAILAPTLDAVLQVNEFMMSLIPCVEVEYLSSDSVCQSDEDSEIHGEWFTTEFLNEIKCSGIPNHKLRLKVGVPVMLMRNIDQSSGLCNGTRLLVKELGKNVIGATVLTGTNIGDKIFIARMNMVPTDAGLPFKFQRRQFLLALCFAMTINKSQGQSLSHVGIFLPKPVFTHGQLYVALSRVKSRKGLKILILDDEQNVTTTTKNVVYREIFDNV